MILGSLEYCTCGNQSAHDIMEFFLLLVWMRDNKEAVMHVTLWNITQRATL